MLFRFRKAKNRVSRRGYALYSGMSEPTLKGTKVYRELPRQYSFIASFILLIVEYIDAVFISTNHSTILRCRQNWQIRIALIRG